ncbi:hypothetical protein [Paractinoplanes brasiliensis]|uniref:NHL repeat-containing protein n=1 Tax=Paractinoplanes brasiliensis TaxID=52695 RepID=A0A4V6PSP2_9ACTN|nr:hypothetical protein [Actinoplanes brasiliensis]TDO32328.1 hypothetical protein C8E87_7785 [Actinoplanes brasiliensis]GID27806.1 hypothetical protein Abr02nite_27890 [Actinoplanes brasiliensis]
MVGSIPRRACAVLLATLVIALGGLVGARPAGAEPHIDNPGETMLYFTAPGGLTRVGSYGYPQDTFPVTGATSVALDNDGSVYVAGRPEAGPLVRELEPSGSWGTSLFPHLTDAADVAVRDGRVVVADTTALTARGPGDEPASTLAPGVHPVKVVDTAARGVLRRR